MKERAILIRRVLICLRVLMGAYFVYMGVSKAMDPVAFMKIVREYGWLASPWPLNAVAALLPWFEVFCGILLVSGFLPRATLWSLIALMIVFTVAVILRGQELAREGGISLCAVKFDCGCGAGVVAVCRKIIENSVCLLFLIFLVFRMPVRPPVPPDDSP